jgi:dihydrofolate reductase
VRRIRYGVATSLDGYIADSNGDFDWIVIDSEIDFSKIATQFDTYLMGRRTFEQWIKGPGAPDAAVWVFSRTMRPDDYPGVTVIADDAERHIRALRTQPGRDIALYGGGQLFRHLLELGQVDAIELAVIPVLLGGGVPFLPAPAVRRRLKLTRNHLYPTTGIVLLEYDIEAQQGDEQRAD